MTRIIALVLAAFAASPSFAQTSATGQEIVSASAAALTAGDAVRAAQLADVILAVKPNNLDGLILRSRAALALGDVRTATALSKQAFRLTSNDSLKFTMARLAAIAHANAGEDTRAQLWLRRARQFAPDEERAAQVGQEFRQLANRNPWSTRLQFGMTPSSNVNGGSTEDKWNHSFFVPLGGAILSVDARDLPGLEIVGGFQSNYRLSAQETSATFLNFGANFRGIVLQQSAVDAENAKERARLEPGILAKAEVAALALPDLYATRDAALARGEVASETTLADISRAEADRDATFEEQVVKGSDFSSASLSAGLLHRRILQDGWDPTSFQLDLNHTWYAGEPYSWQLTASASQTVSVSDQVALNFRVARTERRVLAFDDSDPYSVDSWDGRAGLTYQLANSDRISVSFDVKESVSSRDNNDYSQRGVYADYSFGRAVAGLKFGIGLGYSERDYGFDRFVALDRTDEIITLNARTRFTEIEYYGFQPEVSLNASRTNSVNSRYDTDTVRIGFDLRSSF